MPALLAVAVAAWWGVLSTGFVWDDQALVLRNTMTGDLSNLPHFFMMDLWDSAEVGEEVSGYYRPLMLVSLAVDRALWGLSPAGHHLHSLVWHLLAMAGGYRLLRPLLGWQGATLAVALFGLHPIQSEAVVWVAARNDPMAAALGLWSLALLNRADVGVAGRVGAAVLALLAGLSKESVVLLPLLLLLLDLVQARRPELRRHAPLLLGIFGTLALRVLAGVGGATWPEPIGWRLLAARSPELMVLLGRLIVAPWPLSTGYALEWMDRIPAAQRWFGLGGLAALGFIAWRGARLRGRLAWMGPLWLSITLGPVLVPLADKGLFGERYLYLGMLGVGVAVSLALRAPLHGGALLLLPCLVLIQLRLPDWKAERTLWQSAHAHFPSPYTSSGLAHTYRTAGEDEPALQLFVASLDDPLPDVTVCPQVVGTALHQGRPALAAQLASWAQSRGCSGPAFAGQAASAWAFTGQWSAAAEALRGVDGPPAGRLLVVATALELRAGRLDAAEAMAMETAEPEAVLSQARRMVELGAR